MEQDTEEHHSIKQISQSSSDDMQAELLERTKTVWRRAQAYCFEKDNKGYRISCYTPGPVALEGPFGPTALSEGELAIGITCPITYPSSSRTKGPVPKPDRLEFTSFVSDRPIYTRTPELAQEWKEIADIIRQDSYSLRTCNPDGYDQLLAMIDRIQPGPPSWKAPNVTFYIRSIAFLILDDNERQELEAERQRLEKARQLLEEERRIKRLRTPTKTPIEKGHPGYFIIPSDRINTAAIEALAPGAMQSTLSRNTLRSFGIPESASKYWRVFPFSGNERKQAGTPNTVCGLIGLPQEPEAAIFELLQKNGALAVKAQYALWARAYTDTDAQPGLYVVLSIPQFCDDLGYKRDKDGDHRIPNKQNAMKVLGLLTQIEVCCFYTEPLGKSKRPKTTMLRGPLWTRGMTRMDGYADLFGNAGEGEPSLWDPIAFSYAPGPWFSDPNWRRYNRNVTLVGAGLLALDSRKDRWPIMVGGYVATLARTGGYKSRIIRVETILQKSGLASITSGGPGRQRAQLERALDRIKEMDNPIIGGWHWANEDAIEEPDMDDPETLASLADMDKDDWRRQRLIISWPDDLNSRAQALLEKREQYQEETHRRLFVDHTHSNMSTDK